MTDQAKIRFDSLNTLAGRIVHRFREISRAAGEPDRALPTSVRDLARKHSLELEGFGDHGEDLDLETGKRIDAD